MMHRICVCERSLNALVELPLALDEQRICNQLPYDSLSMYRVVHMILVLQHSKTAVFL